MLILISCPIKFENCQRGKKKKTQTIKRKLPSMCSMHIMEGLTEKINNKVKFYNSVGEIRFHLSLGPVI